MRVRQVAILPDIDFMSGALLNTYSYKGEAGIDRGLVKIASCNIDSLLHGGSQCIYLLKLVGTGRRRTHVSIQE